MKTRFGYAALIAVLLWASGASAADIAPIYKAPPPAKPVVNWTGFYVGGNAGYGWGDRETSLNTTGGNFAFPNFVGNRLPSSDLIPFSGSVSNRPSGFSGGVQAGYNWLINRQLLVGVELDFQSLHQTTASSVNSEINSEICTLASGGPIRCLTRSQLSGNLNTNIQSQIDWFGTLRGRVGFMPNELSLLYATGGLAYGRVHVSGNFQGSAYRITLPSTN